jgi:hypothetical protein
MQWNFILQLSAMSNVGLFERSKGKNRVVGILLPMFFSRGNQCPSLVKSFKSTVQNIFSYILVKRIRVCFACSMGLQVTS